MFNRFSRGSKWTSVRPALILGFFLASTAVAAHAPTSLKAAYKGDFVIGAAINAAQITGQDARGDAIIVSQFNSISPENVLKWALVHPKPDKYDFTLPDRYVAFGIKHHMFIVGHNLVWHNQVPAWVFHDDHGNLITRDALLARMRDHIHTVVGRYKGKIRSWDVVNEALNEDGTMRDSLWLKIIGDDYIEKAFTYAHEADPQAQLTYNDYNLENEKKRNGAIALVKNCRRRESRSHPSACRITTISHGLRRTRKTPRFQHSRRWALRSRSPNSISMCCPAQGTSQLPMLR